MAENTSDRDKTIEDAIHAAEREIDFAKEIHESLVDDETYEVAVYHGICALYEQSRAIIELLKKQNDPLRNY